MKCLIIKAFVPYLCTSYAEKDYQKLDEPVRHEFVKQNQKARSNDDKEDRWCHVDIYKTRAARVFSILNIIYTVLQEILTHQDIPFRLEERHLSER